MINLPQVAKKLEDILNGVDQETIGNTRENDYEFVVATEGFHLDKIDDKETKKNFIPVFVSSMGGEYNPVKGLKQANYNIPVTIYFPVRFKDEFFELNEYLVDCFVGAILTYGTTKCLSNISIAQYGELEELDLNQFRAWVNDTYKKPIEEMGMWMSMTFNLYLSSLGSDFKWGNEGAVSLTYGLHTDSNVIFDDYSLQSMGEPSMQQLLDAEVPETNGLVANTSYSNGFKVYYKSNDMYKAIVKDWFDGKHQTMEFSIIFTFDGNTYLRTCFLMSVNGIFKKGEPVTLTFTLGKKES